MQNLGYSCTNTKMVSYQNLLIIMFENFESIHHYDIRHKKNYRPQNHKIKTILCSGPKVWNTLPKTTQVTLKNLMAIL